MAAAREGGMTCDHCRGLAFIRTADSGVDACKSCAARAEAEWRVAREAAPAPVLRLVARKGKAA